MREPVGSFFLRMVSFGFLYLVPQNNVGIVERFGKFKRIARAGLNVKIPIIDTIKYQTLRIQQLDVDVSTKTSDNVFVDIQVSVQYRVENDNNKIYNSYYELEDAQEQITSYIFDIVRAEVPKLTIDEIFNEKGKIAIAIKEGVGEAIEDFGYKIIQTLVTDIKVDKRIVDAMNDIVASEREKQAAIEKAEAQKIVKIKEAEAEAESKKLQGMGIANERKAIIEGLVESIEDVKKLDDVSTKEILNLILLTQYFDTLKDVANADSNTIMLPGTPQGFNNISEEIREAIISGNLASKKLDN
jgi:regulator of protease activity HflC (stomatin/prohibitin superfamily)